MTETERSLLDAVLENPDDDLPRLVYADYLDENGDPKRAEFIRAQIALAQEVIQKRYDSDNYSPSRSQNPRKNYKPYRLSGESLAFREDFTWKITA